MTKHTLGWTGLLAGLGVARACSGWSPEEGLVAGDTALSRPFETNFPADLIAYHGPGPAAGETRSLFARMHEPSPPRVVVSEGLLVEPGRRPRGGRRRAGSIRPIASYLAARLADNGGIYQLSADGSWKLVVDGPEVVFSRALRTHRFAEKDRPTLEAAYAAAVKELPAEFRLYFRSLDYAGADGALLCDELLALPAGERKHLTALAHYRRARLRMADVRSAGPDDATVRRALAAVRADLRPWARRCGPGAPISGASLPRRPAGPIPRRAVLLLPRLRAARRGRTSARPCGSTLSKGRGASADDSIVHIPRAAAGCEDFAECARS
jgi:hypothetical protein